MDRKPENQNNFKKKHYKYHNKNRHGDNDGAEARNTGTPAEQSEPEISVGENTVNTVSQSNTNRRKHRHKPHQHRIEEALAVANTQETPGGKANEEPAKEKAPEPNTQKSAEAQRTAEQPVPKAPLPSQRQKNPQNNGNAGKNSVYIQNQKPKSDIESNHRSFQSRSNRDDTADTEESNPMEAIAQRSSVQNAQQDRQSRREQKQPKPLNIQPDRRAAFREEAQRNEDTVSVKPAPESPKPLSTAIPGPEVLEDIPKYTRIASSELDDAQPKVTVVGIQFKAAGKVYYFDPGDIKLTVGSHAIVETARGLEFGEVIFDRRSVSENSIIKPLRPVIREATPEDIAHNRENEEKEEDIFKIGQEKIAAHKLDMKLVDAQYTFDNSKLLFYFTSVGRVDFRELVKDLAGVFHTRIELRQIGIRDEAKMMGGLGACGRPLCCASFLADFVQVSIKMAKEQSLSLNSNKISGACGRLMCCLRYEYDSYEAELKLMPPIGSKVKTPDGIGFVTELSPIAGTVKVNLEAQDGPQYKIYKKADISVLSRPAVKAQPDAADDGDVLPNE